MRPINSRFFGASAGAIRARFHDGASVVDGYIVKQVGAERYRVSDGTVVRTCRFARTPAEVASLTSGVMTVRATVRGSGAALSPLYNIRAGSASIVAGGTSYVTGQIVVVGGVGNRATLTVGSLGAGGAIAAISGIPDEGLYSALPGVAAGSGTRRVTVQGGAGSGATIALSFEVVSVRVDAGGSGYAAGQSITFTGGDSASLSTTTPPGGSFSVASVGSRGEILTVNHPGTAGAFGNPPTGFTTEAATTNVRRLAAFRCRTVQGVSYPWSLDQREGRAQLDTI